MKYYVLNILLLIAFALVPEMAQGQNAFADYQKKKAQQQEEYRRKKQEEQKKYLTTKQKELEEYRRKKNAEFAQYMEDHKWESFDIEKAIALPEDNELPPIIYDEKKDNRKEEQNIPVEVVPFETPKPKEQPKPIVPIKENEETTGYSTFNYYGTQLKARWGDLSSFRLRGNDEKAMADAYRKLTDKKYNNLLHDCLAIRAQYDLCDWGYYRMLEILSSTICSKNSNEAIFLQGVLFHQSGYMMRFAFEPGSHKLHLLTKMNGIAYNKYHVKVDGVVFNILDGSSPQKLRICRKAYSGEKEMSLDIEKLPKLAHAPSKERIISSPTYSLNVRSSVNENLIAFFNDYPTSYKDDFEVTRWAYYANTPLSKDVTERVYPQLRTRLANTTPLLAVNILLDWVQIGFEYKKDERVWGQDRAFFAEESLYYPFTDCEDHAILFSHLVRDLVGLDVILVFYPDHLATAVCFDSDVKGDYIMYDNRKFIVADPTYIRAKVGKTMPRMDNSVAKVILCKR